MTPRTVVEQYELNQKIDKEFLQKIKSSSFSRFPVYENDKDNVVGVLHATELLGFDGEENKVIKDLNLSNPEFIQENTNLDDALEKFLKTRKHLFIVKDEFGSVVGVLSLEDIMEEILEQEIVDERDKHEDLRALARKNGTSI